jgi:glycogen(starch) synthase
MATGDKPTRILFCSYAFHPSIGGIEATSLFLIEQLIKRGLDVEVVTNSPAKDGDNFEYGYPVHRRPDRKFLLELVRRSDLIFHNNISINYAWPLLLVRRPLVIASHTPIDATIEKSAMKRWLKFRLMRAASGCVSVSKYLAGTFPVPSRVIYNALRRSIFNRDAAIVRDQQLLFVGRLVEAKGVDVLLQALKLMKAKGLVPQVTLIGGGPEEQRLKAMAADAGIESQLHWAGPMKPAEIARAMNQHEVLVVPSRRKPAEALPLVPIEGIACGAVPVVAEQGGLPESTGPCGVTFECENPQALANALEKVLGDAGLRDGLRKLAPEFLKTFAEETVAAQYLEVFAAAMPGGRLIYR